MNDDKISEAAPSIPASASQMKQKPASRTRDGGRRRNTAVLKELDTLAEQTFRLGFGAEELKWDAKTSTWFPVANVWARLNTLKTYLQFRYSMPPALRAKVEAEFKGRHRELVEIASTPSGQKLLLKIGAVNSEWLRRYAPAIAT